MMPTCSRHGRVRVVERFHALLSCSIRAIAVALVIGSSIGLVGQLTAAGQDNGRQDEPSQGGGDQLRKADLGSTPNSHAIGDLFLAGQFEEEDLETIKAQGIKRIITLRTEDELDWDERALVESADLEFIEIPIGGLDGFTDEVFAQIREELNKGEPTLVHCGAGVRVATVWIPFRVLDEGVKVDQALEEAAQMGLTAEPFLELATGYIKRTRDDLAANGKMNSLESVKPGINKTFLDPDLNVDEYIGRFEIESREVFAARKQVLEACDVKPGASIADVGAGTGIYTRLFSRAVGPEGWIYAVDIAPQFIQHINASAKELNLPNITGVICVEDSINLPPESVDMVFVCDTYHHFEFPPQTLASILKALKPGGTFVVIDFERIPGKTREWTMNHVRAGKEVFRSEVETAGFEFVEEIDVDGLEDNYFLKFRKP